MPTDLDKFDYHLRPNGASSCSTRKALGDKQLSICRKIGKLTLDRMTGDDCISFGVRANVNLG